jgi:hypothetical protein
MFLTTLRNQSPSGVTRTLPPFGVAGATDPVSVGSAPKRHYGCHEPETRCRPLGRRRPFYRRQGRGQPKPTVVADEVYGMLLNSSASP